MYVLVIGCFMPDCGWYLKVELIEEGPPRRLKVEFKGTETGEIGTEEFNTVRC